MFRSALGLGALAILLAASGCTMCCHQYDHSGPVYSDDGSASSSMHSRAGSILGGGGTSQPAMSPTRHRLQEQPNDPIPDDALTPTPAAAKTKKQHKPMSYVMTGAQKQGQRVGERPQGPLLGKAQPGDVAGSERIVSVQDRVVKPADDAPQVAEDAPQNFSRPLPSSGWTARRPTSEMLR
jgi:hypothetical protein